ncbi:MAG: periplasmic heavy metal sensor [Thermodesulfovibrionia bacterium]
MKKLQNIFVLVSILMLTVTLPASARMCKTMEHGKSGMMCQGKKDHGMGHLFGSTWKETLTDEQKMKVDKMHLALKKSTSVLKAKLKVNKIELSILIVKGNPDKKAIYQKIDDILELKREIMRKKYDHKIEMRDILTPEQRVSFDMKQVEKAGRKKGHKCR